MPPSIIDVLTRDGLADTTLLALIGLQLCTPDPEAMHNHGVLDVLRLSHVCAAWRRAVQTTPFVPALLFLSPERLSMCTLARELIARFQTGDVLGAWVDLVRPLCRLCSDNWEFHRGAPMYRELLAVTCADVARAMVLTCTDVFPRLSCTLRGTRAVVEVALRQDGSHLQHASPAMQDNAEVVKLALDHFAHPDDNTSVFQFASERLKADKEVALWAAERSFFAGDVLSARFGKGLGLLDDDDIGLAIVQLAGGNLEHLSSRLRGSKRHVKAAVGENGIALRNASAELRDNDEVVWVALQQNGMALAHASARLCDHEARVLQAVRSNGYALKFASARLKKSRFVVSAALENKHSGSDVLGFADEELRGDFNLALLAVTKKPHAAVWVDTNLLNEHATVFLEAAPNIFQHLSDKTRGKRGIALRAAQLGATVLPYVPSELLRDREIVLAAVQHDGRELEWAEAFQGDQEIALAACKQNGYVLAAVERPGDYDLVRAAVQTYPCALQCLPEGHHLFSVVARLWREAGYPRE